MAKVVWYERITEELVSTVESINAFPLEWKKVILFYHPLDFNYAGVTK
jgi:hypothetical protein